MKRELITFRDGHARRETLFEPLLPGEQGNWQVLKAMQQIVLEDYDQPDIRKFVIREVIRDIPGHDVKGELEACFEFARDRITYRQDPFGTERVADIWSVLYGMNPCCDVPPEGDCGIKSTFFATCVAAIGYHPAFVIAKERPEQTTYNHIYAAVLSSEGDWKFYDPTPEDAPPGWTLEAYDKRVFDIFAE